MPDNQRTWYAIYTKPRWEKKVYGHLVAKGIEAYCPLNKVRKEWSDRVKWVEEPLFKSYVFVSITREEHTGVRMTEGVVNFVYWLGRPAVIKSVEIKAIRNFLNEYTDVWAEPLDLQKDMAVRIQKGVFMDKEARVVKIINNKVQVVIESIGYRLLATVEKHNIKIAVKH